MPIVKTDSIHYSNIAAKIREKTGDATTYPPSEMPSGIDAVYEAGKGAGGGNPYEYLDAFVEGATEITSYATKVGENLFRNNYTVAKLRLPVATSIAPRGCSTCSELTEVHAPEMLNISYYSFYKSTKLEQIECNKVTFINTSAFEGCAALKEIHMPDLLTLNPNAFSGATTLEFAEIGSLKSVNILKRSVFYNCTALVALVMRVEDFVPLENTNAFTGTPIASGAGYIYIPSALIPNFQTATNWSTFANQFRALEDYTVDGTVTGAFDRTKI